MMTWSLLVLIGAAFFVVVLVAVPVGLVVLATSPDVRRTARRAGAALLPLSVIGIGLLAVIGTSTVKVHHVVPQPVPPPPEAAPQQLTSIPDPHGPEVPAPPVDAQTKVERAQSELHLQYEQPPLRMLGTAVVMGAMILAMVVAALAPRWRWPVAGIGVALLFLGTLVPVLQQQREVQRREATQAELRMIGETLHSQPAAAAESVPISVDANVAAAPAETPATEASTADASTDANRPVAITAFAPDSDNGQTVEVLPSWIELWPMAGSTHLTEQFVLTSRRYSSVEEAEQELPATLRPRLGAYLHRHDAPVDPSQITLADVRSSEAILGRVQEQFTVDLGSTQEPVYRMTWQVWLRPSVRDALAADYRLAERDERLWQLGLGAGCLTLLFGAWAAYFRIDDQTQGRYRGRLKLAAIGTTLAGAAVTLLG